MLRAIEPIMAASIINGNLLAVFITFSVIKVIDGNFMLLFLSEYIALIVIFHGIHIREKQKQYFRRKIYDILEIKIFDLVNCQ